MYLLSMKIKAVDIMQHKGLQQSKNKEKCSSLYALDVECK
jgi:hypothetical protein